MNMLVCLTLYTHLCSYFCRIDWFLKVKLLGHVVCMFSFYNICNHISFLNVCSSL